MTSIAPTVYYQVTNDLGGERTMDARFIGLLDPDRTELNLQSALSSSSDKVDNYRIRMMKDGPMGISIDAADKTGNAVDAGTLRYKLLNRAGQVVADSEAKSGPQKDNYDALVATNFNAKQGDYYVQITRGSNTPSSGIYKYSVQIRSTFTYREDYTTVEKPATTSITTYGPNALATTMAQQIKTNTTPYESQSTISKLLTTLSGG